MEIRGKTISYSAHKKKSEREKEENLFKEIAKIEADINNLDENVQTLENLKQELQLLRSKKIEGQKVRSKIQWISQGEKATRYFCNLEKRNFLNKTVSFLDRGNGDILLEQENILSEVHNFYKNLYSFKYVQEYDLEHLKEEAVILHYVRLSF